MGWCLQAGLWRRDGVHLAKEEEEGTHMQTHKLIEEDLTRFNDGDKSQEVTKNPGNTDKNQERGDNMDNLNNMLRKKLRQLASHQRCSCTNARRYGE